MTLQVRGHMNKPVNYITRPKSTNAMVGELTLRIRDVCLGYSAWSRIYSLSTLHGNILPLYSLLISLLLLCLTYMYIAQYMNDLCTESPFRMCIFNMLLTVIHNYCLPILLRCTQSHYLICVASTIRYIVYYLLNYSSLYLLKHILPIKLMVDSYLFFFPMSYTYYILH
jgi:hypothetical protein